jgi:WD40 repeat protein
LWSSADGSQLRSISAHTGIALAVAFAPGGESIATVGIDKAVRLWSVPDGRRLADHHHEAGLWTVQFDRKAKRLLGATAKQPVVVLDARSGTPLLELVGHLGAAEGAEWGADDRLIVTGGRDGTVRLWDASTGLLLHSMQAGEQLWSVAFSHDASRLALAGDDPTPRIWTLPRPLGPGELEQVLRCRVPYEVKDDRVVSRARPPGDCAAAH